MAMSDPALSIWIYKPNVVHKQIFGSRVTSISETLITRVVYPKLYTNTEPFEESVAISYSSDVQEFLFSSSHSSYVITKRGTFTVVLINKSKQSLFDETWLKNTLETKLNSWNQLRITSSPPSLSLIDLLQYQRIYEELKSRYAKLIASFWSESTDPDKFIHEDLGIAAYLLCLWRTKTSDPQNFVDIGCGNGLLVYILNSEGYQGVGVDIRRRKIWSLYPEFIRNNLYVSYFNNFKEETVNPQIHPGFPKATWLIGNHSDELTPWMPVLATRSGPACQVFVIPCCPFSLFSKFDLGKHRINFDTAAESGSSFQGRFRGYTSYIQANFKACGIIPEMDILRIPSTRRLCLIGRSFSESDWNLRMASVDGLILAESKNFVFQPRKGDPGQVSCVLSMAERRDIGAKVFARVLELCPTDGKLTTSDGRLWNPGATLLFTPSPRCSCVGTTIKAELGLFADTQANEALVGLRIALYLIASIAGLFDELTTPDKVAGASESLTDNSQPSRNFAVGQLCYRIFLSTGCLSLREASQLFDPLLLAKLKSLRGGLQTLLRNQHQTFVVSGEGIRLRYDADRATAKQESKGKPRKTKPCWMEEHHPDGCPYPDHLCLFAHKNEKTVTQ